MLVYWRVSHELHWLFDYPNLVGIRELEWQVRIVPQFELNSYHPATAQPLGLTRWEMWRGVRTKKMIEGCQCSVPYLDAYIKMIWTDFDYHQYIFLVISALPLVFSDLSGLTWGNVHLDAATTTLRSLHDAWTPGKFVLAFNGVLSNTSHLVLRCDRCCGVFYVW